MGMPNEEYQAHGRHTIELGAPLVLAKNKEHRSLVRETDMTNNECRQQEMSQSPNISNAGNKLIPALRATSYYKVQCGSWSHTYAKKQHYDQHSFLGCMMVIA